VNELAPGRARSRKFARRDRFFALWVLETTSGMRRSELAGSRLDLLNLDAGTDRIATSGL
jgi:hypothetical protein